MCGWSRQCESLFKRFVTAANVATTFFRASRTVCFELAKTTSNSTDREALMD